MPNKVYKVGPLTKDNLNKLINQIPEVRRMMMSYMDGYFVNADEERPSGPVALVATDFQVIVVDSSEQENNGKPEPEVVAIEE